MFLSILILLIKCSYVLINNIMIYCLIDIGIYKLVGLWCLTPLSTIFE